MRAVESRGISVKRIQLDRAAISSGDADPLARAVLQPSTARQAAMAIKLIIHPWERL